MKKSFQFEYEKFIAGTAFFTRREKGAYIDLLCLQADKGRLTLQSIKDILNGDFECWDKIKSKFTEENGMYFNRKLESVMSRHHKTPDEICQERAKFEQVIKDKKQKFYNDCRPFLEKYPKEMLRAFYNYWTEMNKSGTRLRFELQQTFEISKRLVTWANNDKNIVKTKIAPDEISYKELVRRFNDGETDIWERYEIIVPGSKTSKWRKKIS